MQKILIANRGEITRRIIRTARRMGISTVAVYSDADRNALHVREADEAIYIGAAPSAQSYLAIDKMLDAARQTGAEAIHPGYGFLSENATFARAVAEAGLIFIGPTPRAIELMGSKLAAKDTVKAYGVPLVPGLDHAIQDIEAAKREAKEIGFPILIKASAGGGGKGMRIVEDEASFTEQMERAVSEAESSFGDGSVFIEKYVLSPRHIEIQILADTHGNIVHLFERECSIQRRHQKVIEEAPSSVLDEALRERMGQAAVQVAASCGYVGAGTVEFLVDANLDFYFLEMNTRLQVEHPVTELITGVDLVEQQIRVARGEVLSIKQEDLSINGHAIQLRVYAEDPSNNFLPSVGTLTTYRPPVGPVIRVDDGYEEGMDIPIYYDPMISKLITYGMDRQSAISALDRAIQEYIIEGVETTLPFGRFVCQNEAFKSGHFDTGFVKDQFSKEKLEAIFQPEAQAAAALGSFLFNGAARPLRLPKMTSNEWRRQR